MAFADNLKTLPPVTGLAELILLDSNGSPVATIENKPGKAGSLAVYAALAQRHGKIDAAAARVTIAAPCSKGLQIIGDAVLSIINGIPNFLPISATSLIGKILR